MQENKKNYDHQFTKVYKKVKSDRNLNELQKLILSEIISYQMQGRYFYMTNNHLALEFGCSSKRIQTSISKLTPLLFKEYYYQVTEGEGRPKKRRKLIVEGLIGIVPPEILLKTTIDVKSFKTLEDFMKWANCTFVKTNLIAEFIKLNPIIEKHFGKIL